MSNKINELKLALGAGARVNKYRATINFPSNVGSSSDGSTRDLLCKATSFPGKTIGQIEIRAQGRKLVIPGETAFSTTWQLTFYNKESHDMRNDFIKWMNKIDNFQKNSHYGQPNAVMSNMFIEQLDSDGNSSVKFGFNNVFPQEVGEISLDGTGENQIQEFTVTFSFTDWELLEENGATLNDVAKQ